MNSQAKLPSRGSQILQIIIAAISLILGFFVGLIALGIAIMAVTSFAGYAWWKRRKYRNEVINADYRVVDK
jgi:O-antigen/teichoic acid export membrane protein